MTKRGGGGCICSNIQAALLWRRFISQSVGAENTYTNIYALLSSSVYVKYKTIDLKS